MINIKKWIWLLYNDYSLLMVTKTLLASLMLEMHVKSKKPGTLKLQLHRDHYCDTTT